MLSTVSVSTTNARLPDALGRLIEGRTAGDAELVQSASDALVAEYGAGLAAAAVALLAAALLTAWLVTARKDQVDPEPAGTV